MVTSNAPFDAALTRPRSVEHGEHRIADRHRTARLAFAVDQRQLAVVAVIAHQAIDFGERRERFVDRGCGASPRRRRRPAPRSRCPSGTVLVGFLRLSAHHDADQQRGSDGRRRRRSVDRLAIDRTASRMRATCSRSRRSGRRSRRPSLHALPDSASCTRPQVASAIEDHARVREAAALPRLHGRASSGGNGRDGEQRYDEACLLCECHHGSARSWAISFR